MSNETVHSFSGERFKAIFQEFSNEVYSQRLEKLAYDQWRFYAKSLDGSHVIEVIISVTNGTVKIKDRNTDKILGMYEIRDHSFGEFLYNRITKGDDYYMRTKDLYEQLKEEWDKDSKADPRKWLFDSEPSWQYRPEYLPTVHSSTTNMLSSKPPVSTFAEDTNTNSKKENTNMMFNFDFGPVDSNIHMSPYGMAIKNADGKYVSYDRNAGHIIDVEIFNFEAHKFLYKIPVAVGEVAVGDMVIHMRKPMFVTATSNDRVSVIDVFNGEVKDIIPTRSPFGFDFMTKIVSLIDMSGADSKNPFGNMLPFLLMSDSGKGSNDNMMMAMAMSMMSGNTNMNFMSNPLMMMALMDNKSNDNTALMLAMMMNQPKPVSTCACGGNCSCAESHE